MTATVTPDLEARLIAWFAARRWTEADYLLFASDNNALLDLVDGKVVMHEMPTPRHQAAVVALARALGGSSRGRLYVAPMPIRLGPDRMREPDVMFFRSENTGRIHAQYADPPDLVVEVLSPSTRSLDLGEKLSEYAAAGIPEYWVVDLDAGVIDVFLLTGQQYGPARRFDGADGITPIAAPDVSVSVSEVVAELS